MRGNKLIVVSLTLFIVACQMVEAQTVAYFKTCTYSDELKREANEGELHAMNDLGCCYDLGNGVEQNHQKALEWFLKCGAMSGESAFNIGYYLENGIVEPRNLDAAIKWYSESAAKGYGFAYYRLGKIYSSKGMMKESANFYLKGALRGVTLAAYALAIIYEEGIGVEENLKASLNWYRYVADNKTDNPTDPMVVASEGKAGQMLFFNGDVESAMVYLRRAADKNQPDALYTLGMLLYEGDRITKNHKEAVSYLQRFLDNSDPLDVTRRGDALQMLSVCHLYGLGGLKENRQKAIELAEEAAKCGNQEAIRVLPEMK